MGSPNGQSQPADLPNIVRRIAAIEGAIQKLATLHNDGVRHQINAFQAVDQHVAVLQRICNDVARGVVRYWPLHEQDAAYLETEHSMEEENNRCWLRPGGSSSVHLGYYYEQYTWAVYFDVWLHAVRKLVGCWLPPEPVKEVPAVSITEQQDENTTYFGGDYEVSQSQATG